MAPGDTGWLEGCLRASSRLDYWFLIFYPRPSFVTRSNLQDKSVSTPVSIRGLGAGGGTTASGREANGGH